MAGAAAGVAAVRRLLIECLISPLLLAYVNGMVGFEEASQLLSLVPGRLGMWMRRVWYERTLARCGKNLQVGFLSWMRSPSNTIGDNVLIGPRCVVGIADIGNDVLFAGGVIILNGRHNHRFNAGGPVERDAVTRTSIGDGVWIGEGALILVSVAINCLVGAGSVVTTEWPANAVLYGEPALLRRFVKEA
jgi:virginiamycin A acetyltransferase